MSISTPRQLGRLVGEVAVIVVGVLLALWAEQWRQGREEAVLEQLYVARIAEEVELNRAVAQATRANQTAVLDQATRTYSTLLADPSSWSDPVAIVVSAYTATRTFFPEFVDDVYQELLSTGSARLIEDPQLRSQIFGFYRSLRPPPEFAFASLEYRDLVRGVVPPDVKLEIRDCSFRCAPSLTPERALAIVREIRGSGEALRGLSHVIEQWARGQAYFETVSQRAVELQTALQASMAE